MKLELTAVRTPVLVPGIRAKAISQTIAKPFAEAIAEAKTTRFDDRRILNVRPDLPDFRDRFYEPSLVVIREYYPPDGDLADLVRDQGDEGTCAGQALAAAIDIQNIMRRPDTERRARVSARMLYEMARLHDEFPDDGLEGSSARGAIKGFFHNGVCFETPDRADTSEDTLAPYAPWEPAWQFTVARAKAARRNSLGSYMRLRHVLYDYHAALNEAGALFVTAMVHTNWAKNAVRQNEGRIVLDDNVGLQGAHAFCLVGYDQDGFFVLNSWGEGWGGYAKMPGIAHWSYEDWQKHILDAWVLRLAVPSPKTFHLVGGYNGAASTTQQTIESVPRIDVIGHYCHVLNGAYVTSAPYANTRMTFEETAGLLRRRAAAPVADRYKHLVLYCHGGLEMQNHAVKSIAVMAPVFKKHCAYFLSFLWRTSLMDALGDVLLGHSARAGLDLRPVTDVSDWLLEGAARALGRPLWSEMKDDAARTALALGNQGQPAYLGPGNGGDASIELLKAAIDPNAGPPLKIHLVGHSAGAILLGWLIQRWSQANLLGQVELASVSLFAPACTSDFFEREFAPLLGRATAPDMAMYVLSEQQELEDSVGPYRKSLLHLISKALEEEPKAPILGMLATARRSAARMGAKVYVSGAGRPAASSSLTHGGFDNDPVTLNHMLVRILGGDALAEAAVRERGGFTHEMFKRYGIDS